MKDLGSQLFVVKGEEGKPNKAFRFTLVEKDNGKYCIDFIFDWTQVGLDKLELENKEAIKELVDFADNVFNNNSLQDNREGRHFVRFDYTLGKSENDEKYLGMALEAINDVLADRKENYPESNKWLYDEDELKFYKPFTTGV